MTRTNLLRRFVPLVALAVVVGGCGGGSGDKGGDKGGDTAGAPGTTGAPETAISIKNFVYSPVTAELSLGQGITVTNEDSAAHTLTVPGGIDSGNLAQGESFTFTPTEAGELDYLCDIHQYMTGKIIVR